MEGHCSTGQSPHWAVVPMEEEEEKEDMVSNDTGSHPTTTTESLATWL